MSSQCPLLRYCCQGLGQSADWWTIVSGLSACRHSQSWHELINVTGLQQSPPSKEHSGVLDWSWQYLKISLLSHYCTRDHLRRADIFVKFNCHKFCKIRSATYICWTNLTKLKTSRTSIIIFLIPTHLQPRIEKNCSLLIDRYPLPLSNRAHQESPIHRIYIHIRNNNCSHLYHNNHLKRKWKLANKFLKIETFMYHYVSKIVSQKKLP